MKDDVTRRIVNTLDIEIRRRGRGSIKRVTDLVGRGDSWWRQRLEAGDMDVSQLMNILGDFGMSPIRLLREVGADDGLAIDRPTGGPPPIVEKAWDRFASKKHGDMGAGYLKDLDQRRYREPEEVIECAHAIIDHVKIRLLPSLLGIAGSAYRLWNIRLDDAAHSILAGVEMCQRMQGLDTEESKLLLRLAYVMADRGSHASALTLTERAMVLALRCGDGNAFLRALTNQGMWLHYLGRHDEAIATFKLTLGWLPKTEHRHIFTSLQWLSLCCREAGATEEAIKYLDMAESTDVDLHGWAQEKMLWLRANLNADLGDLDEAAGLLTQVVEAFSRVHLGEMALAACDLVGIELRRGNEEVAYEVACRLRLLVEPLRHNAIVNAAVATLLRNGSEGLTLALARAVKAKIEGELKHGESRHLIRADSGGAGVVQEFGSDP